MAIKWIGQEWCPDARDYRREFVCDTDADLSKLPAAPYGSTALVAASGKTCIVNASGQWIDTETGKVIPGAGVSSGTTGGSSGSSGGSSGGSGVSHWDDLEGRPFYDTRAINTVEPAAVTGLAYPWGEIKISDTLDFDMEQVIAVSGTIRDPENPSVNYFELWKDVPVYAGRMNNDENSPTCLLDKNGNGRAYFIYIANQTEADWWFDGEGDVNPYTPGLYMCVDFDSGMSATAECTFTISMGGELKTIDPKFLPEGVPYDSREYGAIKSDTIVGTVGDHGLIKVSDNLDFDLSTATYMNLKINDYNAYTDYPVVAEYIEGPGSPLGVFERFSDGSRDSWVLAMYFANENEISWWFDDVPDGFTPGFYFNIDDNYNEEITVSYSFEGVLSGELRTVASDMLPEGVPHIDESGNGHRLPYNLLPYGVPYAGYDENGNEVICRIEDKLLDGALKFKTFTPTVPFNGGSVYNGTSPMFVYGNGVYIMAQYSSNTYAYSTDLNMWVTAVSPLAIYNILFGNGMFVCTDKKRTAIFVSVDGIAWESVNMPFTVNENSYILFANDRFFVNCGTSGMFYSYDLRNWFACVFDGFTDMGWLSQDAIAYGNGKYVIGNRRDSTSSRPAAFYSTDGIVWHKGSVSERDDGFSCVCFGNGRFVALSYGQGGTFVRYDIFYSTDGVSWTQYGDSQVTKMIFANGMFVGLYHDGTNLTTSENGTSWRSATTVDGNSQSSASIYYYNNKFLWVFPRANGWMGGPIYVSSDANEWTREYQALIASGSDSVIPVKAALGLSDQLPRSCPDTVTHMYMQSSTTDPINGARSTKLFKITVDDSGTLTATEVTA